MGKRATKAANSEYCQARYKMAEKNTAFESREKTAEVIGINDITSLLKPISILTEEVILIN